MLPQLIAAANRAEKNSENYIGSSDVLGAYRQLTEALVAVTSEAVITLDAEDSKDPHAIAATEWLVSREVRNGSKME